MRYNGKAFAQRGIAQLVEQRSPKPRAEGSNPSAPAKAPADLGGSFFVSLKDSNPPAARAAVMPQGAALCGDRGGQMQRGPRSKALRGVPKPSAPAKAPADLGGSFLFPSPILPPLCKGRWRTNVSRRGCRHGAGEGGLVPKARSYTLPTTPQSNPSGLPAPLTQGSQALRGTKVSLRGSQACGGAGCTKGIPSPRI